MPSLSVHQQKAQRKGAVKHRLEVARRKKQRHHTQQTNTTQHPDLLAAADWLAAFDAAAESSSGCTSPTPLPSSPPPSVLSPSLFDAEAVDALRLSFSSAQPFPHVVVPSFLHPEFARHLLSEVRVGVEYSERCTDLYHFHQSSDLKAATTPLLVRLREELYGERFRRWMERLSGGQAQLSGLEHSVSMSCAVYGDTHRLLCHDDRLQGRRIAYILYLVPQDWSEGEGGQLDLFASDAHTAQPQPRSARSSTTSLLPRWNSFAAFQVSPVSFHAVREVTVQPDAQPPRLRVSISGWFHSPGSSSDALPPAVQRGPLLTHPPLALRSPAASPSSLSSSPSASSPSSPAFLSHWLSPTYCAGGGGVRAIRRRFQADSSVELRGILQPQRYQELLTALAAVQREEAEEAEERDDGWEERRREAEDERLRAWRWRWHGPLQHGHYQRCAWPIGAATAYDDQDATQRSLSVLDDFSRFVRSTEFSAWLGQVTGMSLQGVGGEWRRFTQGSYTLAHDGDEESRMEACDVTFCFLTQEPTASTTSSSPSSRGATQKVKGRSSSSSPSPYPQWDPSWGGSVHYIAAGVEEELLCIPPTANTLTLVYRAGSSQASNEQDDDDTGKGVEVAVEGEEEGEMEEGGESGAGAVMHFVQYVNHHAPSPRIDCELVWRVAPT